MWGCCCCSIESLQVHLKRYLSIMNAGRHQRTLGSCTLQKHLHWRLKRTFALRGFHEKMKHFAVSPQFPLSFSHKNKRWFFKVPVSALFDILTWVWPNNSANPSAWKSEICCDYHHSPPSPVSKSMASRLFSLFLYPHPQSHGQNTTAIKIKTGQSQSWLNLGILVYIYIYI